MIFMPNIVYGADDFMTEAKRITELVDCKSSKIMPASKYGNALYSCITGKEDTVKIFINADDSQTGIKNIKFMWNEYTTNKIPGIASGVDRNTAAEWLEKISSRYFPNENSTIINTFFNSSENSKFSTGTHSINFSYFKGPSIDERLITITID